MGGHKERVNEDEYGECILYSKKPEYSKKTVEIVLRKRGRGEGNDGWRNLAKIHC
jgi:hypothetical protein